MPILEFNVILLTKDPLMNGFIEYSMRTVVNNDESLLYLMF